MSRILGFVTLAALATACVPQSDVRYAQTQHKAVDGPRSGYFDGPKGSGASTKSPAKPCDLRLFIEQAPSDGVRGIDPGHLGAAVVERTDLGFVDGVCIKPAAEPLVVPAEMIIAGTSDSGLDRFCRGDPEPTTLAYRTQLPAFSCIWNGRFHSARPFTFTLVSAEGTAVGDLVELVRVFRNGDLMAAWNRTSDQPSKHVVTIEGNPLRTGFLAATIPPHLSAMDFRILPRGTAASDAIDLTVRDDHALAKSRALAALKAAANEALPPDSPARKSLACLKEAVIAGREQVLRIVRGEAPVPAPNSGCEMPLGLEEGTPLSDEYQARKNQTRDKLVELRQRAEAKLDGAGKALEQKVRAKAEQAIDAGVAAVAAKLPEDVQKELESRAKAAKVSLGELLTTQREKLRAELGDKVQPLLQAAEQLAKDADAQIKFALRSVDEARALAIELSNQARGLVVDTDRQAQIFLAVAESLGTGDDVFEARRDNPLLVPGEQAVKMRYSDHFQGYMLAPWNGVPIRLNGGAKADLNAGTAIPLIDVAGLRLQWGTSRFGDARLGVGVGYVATEPVGETQSKSAAMPFVSGGFGTVKFGLGVVTIDAGPRRRDYLRFILGADLFKLISGSNVEAL